MRLEKRVATPNACKFIVREERQVHMLRKTSKTVRARWRVVLIPLVLATPAFGQATPGQEAQPSAKDPNAPPSSGDDARKSCSPRHVHAQLARREGKLREARSDSLACSRPACPA